MDQNDKFAEAVNAALAKVNELEPSLKKISSANHARVLTAFVQNRVSDFHFSPSTGYGYGDTGRDVLERIFADIFGGESALVRNQIVSGTHAIYLALKAATFPDRKLYYLGMPYDTLKSALGLNEAGRCYNPLSSELNTEIIPINADKNELIRVIKNKIEETNGNCVIAIQRSAGYSIDRLSFSIDYIKYLIAVINNTHPNAIVFVDNCYGEFVETKEPPMVGADLTAGSLIKNPGGSIAPGGGYLVGNSPLIELAAQMLTAPFLGKEVGASLWDKRLVFQGLYMAPLLVTEAICGMIFTSELMGQLGLNVMPKASDKRTDIIQRIDFNSPDILINFCQRIQHFSPVDSHVTPQPAPLPGYAEEVIMAAGTFVQGASLELSADAPIRPPYSVFLQGGISREYTVEIISKTVKSLMAENYI